MNTNAPRNNVELSALAERQMRNWALGLQTRQRVAEEAAKAPLPMQLYPYVAISRETGAGAVEIAETVGQKLGWKVLDRDLLNCLAEHNHWSRVALECVDERTVSWFHDTFALWLDNQLVSQTEYVSRLIRVALLAAQHESAIFIGRGVQFILPPAAGLTVRVIAPKKWRIERVMARFNFDSHKAEKFIGERDKGRADFVRRYFHRDVADPHLYDLVINLQHTTREAAAEMIVSNCTTRFDQL